MSAAGDVHGFLNGTHLYPANPHDLTGRGCVYWVLFVDAHGSSGAVVVVDTAEIKRVLSAIRLIGSTGGEMITGSLLPAK